MAISYCRAFKYFYINYYTYKVICNIVGYKYGYIIGKGVLVSISGIILFIVVTEWLKALLTKVVAIKIILCYFT